MFEIPGSTGGPTGWEGQVTRVPVTSVGAGSDLPALGVAQTTGQALVSQVADAGRSVRLARHTASHVARASVGELETTMAGLDELRRSVDIITIDVLLEAVNRGLHTDIGMGVHDYVTTWCPWLTPTQASDLAVIALAANSPGHEPVTAAVLAGVLTPRRAAKLLRTLSRIRPACDQEAYGASITAVLPPALEGSGCTEREFHALCEHLLVAALPDKDTQAREHAAQQARGMHESSLADGSLTRFIITAEAEGAALFRSILTSPLAAPAPDEQEPDSRTATQRRYDALLTVLGRGVASAHGVPATAKAQIMVTISLATLTAQVCGLATTTTGHTIPASVLRRLACEADIIPAVLGTHGELLDLGRTKRLTTPGLLRALWHRDKGCSYPGCTVPPGWTDAHHITPWAHGGPTSLDNLALLCRRHHTLVHQNGMSATTTALGVTWHRP